MKIEIINQTFFRIVEPTCPKLDIWFIHGFSESGLSFSEALTSLLAKEHRLIIPDLPGFGVSPYTEKFNTVEASTNHLEMLIKDVSGDRPIGIVAHSMGGILGTWIVNRFKGQIKGIINIEGNLTQADCFFSGKAVGYTDPNLFYAFFKEEVLKIIGKDEALHRYYASIRFADPRMLLGWGNSGAKATGLTKAGDEYVELTCKKLYIFGKKSAPIETQSFIKKRSLDYCEFSNSGHWPMIDEASSCYQTITEFFR